MPELVQWSSELSNVGNMITEVVDQTKETLDIFSCTWLWPFLDIGDFAWVERYTLSTDTKAQEIHAVLSKVAFVRVKDQVDLYKPSDCVLDIDAMLVEVARKDDDVLNEGRDIGRVVKNVVDHPLELG